MFHCGKHSDVGYSEMERGTRLMDEGSSDEKCRECGRGIVTAVRCYDGKVDQQEAGKKQKKKKKG